MQAVTIGNNQAGQRLDKFLRRLLPGAGSGFLYKMLRKKNITLNGKKAEGSELLEQGDVIRIFFSDETFSGFSQKTGEPLLREEEALREYARAYRELTGVSIIYEDEHILILDKPAGMLTQKAEKGDHSLNEWMIGSLLERDPAFRAALREFHPSVCNRLDRNTSGLVLCGKSLPGLQFLSQCIRERTVRKFYRTICLGQIREPAHVKGYLKKEERGNRVTVSPAEAGNLAWLPGGGKKSPAEAGNFAELPGGGKRSSAEAGSFAGLPGGGKGSPGEYIETAYRPLCVNDGYTLLEVELITGKPHQIRAHLAAAGHPLAGDFKYGDRDSCKRLQRAFGLEHQLLHAFRVEFPESTSSAGTGVSGKTFTAPCPGAFEEIRRALGLS